MLRMDGWRPSHQSVAGTAVTWIPASAGMTFVRMQAAQSTFNVMPAQAGIHAAASAGTRRPTNFNVYCIHAVHAKHGIS
jgi:hypothetical protein